MDDYLATMLNACCEIDSLNIDSPLLHNFQPPVELHHFSIAYWPNTDQSYENKAFLESILSTLNEEIEVFTLLKVDLWTISLNHN